nr:MAG TPA: hypothetical protein [Caudoviricetes sp.]
MSSLRKVETFRMMSFQSMNMVFTSFSERR